MRAHHREHAALVSFVKQLAQPLQRSLRVKFITVIVVLQLSLMGLVTVVIEHRQRTTILQESRKRALSLATHLAALSTDYLLSYDFIKLAQTVEQVAAEDDVAYAIVHLHDGKVAAYSGQSDRQGQVLDDPVSRHALQAHAPLVQDVTTAALHGRGYDVAIPVLTAGGDRSWGTIRLGFSLMPALHEVRKTSQWLWLFGVVAVVLGTGAAILLATRIARPIRQLVTGVNAVARGRYDQPITVTSRDDIGYLARCFEEMREALRRHIASLAEEKQRLERSNQTLLETQHQLIRSERAVGNLAAKVAHEVNNPLAIVKASLYFVKQTLPSDDPNREHLDIMGEEISRVSRMIQQLLDFARPAVNIEPLHINEEIHKLMKFVGEDLTAHGIACHLDFTAEIPVLHLAVDHLKQVLLNLIKNAKEAMPHGGTLRLRTAPQSGGVTISVSDTGTGIPAAHLASIFEPFFSTKKANSEGMGLGLAISASIIKSYGGSIEVESQVGQGTTFHIFLPECSPQQSVLARVEEATTASIAQHSTV